MASLRCRLDDLFTRLQAGLAERYSLERELGHGGMATVYLAHDRKHNRAVAIKVLRPELAASVGAERFLREIQITARLQHPHILALLDSGQGDGFLYYVMPYVGGESLREKLGRDGRMPIADAVHIIREILDALSYAHEQGIVHRDVKPENVILSGRHALVADFGVAKAVSDATTSQTLTTMGVAVGTPAYMAPEQAAADPQVDQRADIYAVGALAYEMLAGRPPFTGETARLVLAAQVSATPAPLSRYREDVPAALTGIVMRCLAKQPEQRWQTAEELLTELEGLATSSGERTPAGTRPLLSRVVPRHRAAVLGVVALVLLLGGTKLFTALRSTARVHWAREQAMPQILQLIDSGSWEAAYQLALRATALIPGDSLLVGLLRKVATPVRIRSAPAGARVYRRPYAATDTAWQYLGTTPVDSVWFPGTWGTRAFSRLKLEKPGYRTLEAAAFSYLLPDNFILNDGHTFPPGMVRVPGGALGIDLPELNHLKPVKLGDFLLDAYEVTNREYKRFVQSGAYQQPGLWDYPFVLEGHSVSWEAAMARFKDKTGRAGPASWEAGDYPAEQADYPVAGVSWYEAAAYAKFVGKELPTIWHWSRAAGTWASAAIVPASNIAGKGPARVGSYPGVGPYGSYDMAGNVREWCWNETDGRRYILGGGWNDPTYAFNDAYTQPPFDRSPTNGFRLARYFAADSNLTAAKRPIHGVFRDYTKERPVSNQIFAIYRRLYDYDRTPLGARVEERDSSAAEWVRERVSFDAAYGNERVIAYLFLPKQGHPPYQTIVYFPGSFALFASSLAATAAYDLGTFDFILKSGRALIFPVYKGTYERRDELRSDIPDQTNLYKDHVVMWAKDLRRSVDYLETRPDVDKTRLAYYGVSLGGRLGGLLPAVEPRFRAVVLYVAGLRFQKLQPEVDPFNFLPRIKMPVLMLNGRYDHYFPLETSQRPMFRWLGTPPANKRQVIYDGGHFVPRPQLIRETLDWLDRYLGLTR